MLQTKGDVEFERQGLLTGKEALTKEVIALWEMSNAVFLAHEFRAALLHSPLALQP